MAGTATRPELVLRSLDATWNADRWETLGDDGNRYEVIAGVLYMTTAPSPFHQWLSRQVARLLYAALDDRGLGLTLVAPVGLFLPGLDPVQPDLFVLRPADAALVYERRIDAVPLLIVEILSPSNPEHDLVVKRDGYARAGVPEYWVVRQAERDVLVQSEPEPASGSCHLPCRSTDPSRNSSPGRRRATVPQARGSRARCLGSCVHPPYWPPGPSLSLRSYFGTEHDYPRAA